MAHRSYEQYCPIAAALDVVGDRWTLLIMRELLIGDRRFTDLRGGLPGLAPNLLADRLRDLQADGLVEQKVLPPPAARTVYAATRRGRTLLPVLQSLARFGVDRLGPPQDAAVRPSMAVYGVITPYHHPEPPGARFHTRLHVDGETFDVVTDGDRLSARPRPDDDPDLTITTSARDVVAARQAGTPLAAAMVESEDADSLARFTRLFELA